MPESERFLTKMFYGNNWASIPNSEHKQRSNSSIFRQIYNTESQYFEGTERLYTSKSVMTKQKNYPSYELGVIL